jgi:hypothetical protein
MRYYPILSGSHSSRTRVVFESYSSRTRVDPDRVRSMVILGARVDITGQNGHSGQNNFLTKSDKTENCNLRNSHAPASGES